MMPSFNPAFLPSPTLGFFGTPPPPPLAAPPLLEHLIYESPWIPVALLVVAALVALVIGNARAKLRVGGGVAIVLLALAGVLALTASLVTTDREVIASRMRQLTEAVAIADVSGVEAMLDSEARLFVLNDSRGAPVPQILSRVERELGEVYRVESYQIADLQTEMRSSQIALAQIRVIVTPELTSAPTPAWLRVEWIRRETGGDWKVRQIEVVQVAGMTRGGP